MHRFVVTFDKMTWIFCFSVIFRRLQNYNVGMVGLGRESFETRLIDACPTFGSVEEQ